MKFDVRFYLVAILFIIFDLEVDVPVPVGRSRSMPDRHLRFLASMMAFLWASSTVGFIYEWKKGALEWE